MKDSALFKQLEKINKDILKVFKDHVEWIKYKDNVVYPFWKTCMDKKLGIDPDFEKWYNGILKDLLKRGKKQKVIPQYDSKFEPDVKVTLDFSKYNTPNPFTFQGGK